MKTAVDDWHKRMQEEEKKKHPEKFHESQRKSPSPGPGHYTTGKGPMPAKTFQKPHQAAFGSNDPKKINTVDKVQIPQVDNPGPGQYQHERKSKNISNASFHMMSKTTKVLNGQILHNSHYPSSTHYDTANFNTIDHPMVTGGSPNNTLALIKFEKA